MTHSEELRDPLLGHSPHEWCIPVREDICGVKKNIHVMMMMMMSIPLKMMTLIVTNSRPPDGPPPPQDPSAGASIHVPPCRVCIRDYFHRSGNRVTNRGSMEGNKNNKRPGLIYQVTPPSVTGFHGGHANQSEAARKIKK